MKNDRIALARMAFVQLSSRERLALVQELAPAPEVKVPTTERRIVRRTEAAQILGRSCRAVDRLAVEGILTKVKLPGRTRAAGFRLADIHALFAGGAS